LSLQTHKKTAAVFALIILAGTLGAMSWPGEQAGLFRNFGSNDNGNPALGMVFTVETDVLAAEAGDVIFSRGVDDTASRLPSPLGAWTAIDHGDGLISIYSRYSPEESRIVTQVEKEQPIASPGISGWSSYNGFYFIVYDRRERRWINPAMIITPMMEARQPQIISVELRNAQGVPVRPGNLTQGRYTILVNANSIAAARLTAGRNFPAAQLAPHRIVCSVNGAEVGSINFEAVSARDGVLMIYRNGLVPAKQIYANYPAFETAEVFLTRGQANLEIIVQDAAGNSRNYASRMIVN
jgi:hypothetical protein